MEKEIQHNGPHQDDVSLREVFLKMGYWWRYLCRKWVVILLAGICGAGLGLLVGFMSKPKYVAELNFVLEDTKSSSLGAYAGIASQFGIDLSGSSGESGVFSGDNILGFLKSRLMVGQTLLSPIKLDEKDMTMADAYIEINDLKKSWQKEPELANISFPLGLDPEKFTRTQDSVLGVLFDRILKDELTVEKPDKKLSFINVKYIGRDETFAIKFTNALVENATDFYVVTKTKRAKVNVDNLQRKADSILNVLNKKTVVFASEQDINVNPARKMASVSSEMTNRDKIILQTMYGEVVKNLELSRASMEQETPLIQVIDVPIEPLKKKKIGKLMGLIIGGFLGGFLSAVALMTRGLYKQIMRAS